jgi:4-amino-4-deoxy-L-arabinose transferase-like glycosyltransferase
MVLLFLLLTPFYQFHGQRFASNQTLLSTWPIATWCFLRAYETRGLAWAAAAGATAALAMLGKYYSAFLVAGFIVAALAHPARLAYLRSASPWVSIAVGLIVLGPHLYWAATTGFQPIAYATGVHAGATLPHVAWKAALYLAGALGYAALPTALMLIAARPDLKTLREVFWPENPDRRMLVVLLAVPLLLPVPVALATGTILTPLWSMSAWFLLPIVLLAPAGLQMSRGAALRIAALVAAITLGALAAAPVLAWRRHVETDKDGRAWSRLVSAELTRRWHDATGHALRLVAGNPDFAAAATFYSADRPSFIPGFRFDYAPWATDERRARDGFAAICRQGEAECIAQLDQHMAAWPGATRREVEVTRTFLGRAGEPGRFVLGLFPPKN